jgi:hypothetical protein
MKKQNLFLGLFALLAFATVYWLVTRRSQPIAGEMQTTNSLPVQQHAQSGGTASQLPQKQQDSKPAISSSTVPESVMEYVKKIKADPQYDWKQPINFWGRVVDESNVPVANASIHFTWNDISEKGTSDADAKSDGNGFFSLTDRRGKRLYVDVGKEGYYSSGNSRGSAFEYANPADGLFTPDQNNPVVFHLRKKGVGVDLVTSQNGMKPYFGVTVPLDGAPVQVDLLERKTGEGQMVISQVKPEYKNWKQATNWLFRMGIPDGGFIEENDEFPFEAPIEGYQSVLEFNFQQDLSDRATNIRKDYYIKFGNPSRYGWLKLDTSILMEGARLTYAINPTGSRNLEPK